MNYYDCFQIHDMQISYYSSAVWKHLMLDNENIYTSSKNVHSHGVI